MYSQIALSSNDDKRLLTFDRIVSDPYYTNAGKQGTGKLGTY